MAKHWSADVYILCWSDPASDGRMRMSWGSREKCERTAEAMTEAHDAVMYNGFGARVVIRPPAPKNGRPKRKSKARAKKRTSKPDAVAA